MTEDSLSDMDEIKSKIQELEKGMMEIAHEVGRLKGELKAHKDKPDAHHPAMIGKDVN